MYHHIEPYSKLHEDLTKGEAKYKKRLVDATRELVKDFSPFVDLT